MTTITKNRLRSLLTMDVGPVMFVLACVLLASVLATARVMTDRVIKVQETPTGLDVIE
jgi:hypothetical protein